MIRGDLPSRFHCLVKSNADGETWAAPRDLATEVIAGKVTSSFFWTDWYNESHPTVSLTTTSVFAQPTSRKPCAMPRSKPPPPTQVHIKLGGTVSPASRNCAHISCTSVACPVHVSSPSNGCAKNASSSAAIFSASSFASDHCFPCTITFASYDSNRSRINSGVVSGTTTVVFAPNLDPLYATAKPAFPPLLETNVFFPSRNNAF